MGSPGHRLSWMMPVSGFALRLKLRCFGITVVARNKAT